MSRVTAWEVKLDRSSYQILYTIFCHFNNYMNISFSFYIPTVVIICISFYVTLQNSSFQQHRFIEINNFHSTGTIFSYLADWIASMYTFKGFRKYDTILCQKLIIKLGIITKTRLGQRLLQYPLN